MIQTIGKKRFFTSKVMATLLLLVFAIPNVARAQITQRSLATPGDGLLTYDASTGLEWLDVAETGGMTWDEAETAFPGFRHATKTEVIALVEEFEIEWYTSNAYTAANFDKCGRMLEMMGELPTTNSNRPFHQGAYDIGSATNLEISIVLLEILPNPIGLATIPQSTLPRTFQSPVVGHYLVRTATAVSLTEKDLNTAGDGLLTFDPASGLEWLDISETENMTWAQAEAAFPEFRHATKAEVIGLVEEFGINWGGSGFFTAPNYAPTFAMLDLMGTLVESNPDYPYHQAAYDIGSPSNLEISIVQLYLPTSVGKSTLPQSTLPITFQSPVVGHYLVRPTNTAPTADAGANQSIRVGDVVTLDGSESFDDNTAQPSLVYDWSFVSTPVGSNVELDDNAAVEPTFIADIAGTYTLALVVTDERTLVSDPAFVEVSSENLAPTAVIEVDYSLAIVGEAIHFDGGSSSDPEMDVLSYSWVIIEAPLGSVAVLNDADTATPSLTTDLEGTYSVVLVVSDFLGPGAPVEVEITSTHVVEFAEILIVEASDIIESLSRDQFVKKAIGKSLSKRWPKRSEKFRKGISSTLFGN